MPWLKEGTNNDSQIITQEAEDRATGIPLNTGGELMFSGRVDNYSLE